jgi:hypothetical protein
LGGEVGPPVFEKNVKTKISKFENIRVKYVQGNVITKKSKG